MGGEGEHDKATVNGKDVQRPGNGAGWSNAVIWALVFVLVALFILFPILGPHNHPHEARTHARAAALTLALLLYREDCHDFPAAQSNREYVQALTRSAGRASETIFAMDDSQPSRFLHRGHAPSVNKNGEYLDSWGTPFEIRIDRKAEPPTITIISWGANRQNDNGGKDDIVRTSAGAGQKK